MRRLLLAACMLAACAPDWNWRELALADGMAHAQLACKPAVQTRAVAMPGRAAPLRMMLWSCEHGGVTQALAWADVGEPAQASATLRLWREAALRNLAARSEPVRRDWPVRHATPQPEAGLWAFTGLRGDGAALHVQTGLAAHGAWVLQATLLAPEPLPPAVAQAFFDGVAFAR